MNVIDKLTSTKVSLSYARDLTEEPTGVDSDSVIFAIDSRSGSLTSDFELVDLNTLEATPQHKQPDRFVVTRSKTLPVLPIQVNYDAHIDSKSGFVSNSLPVTIAPQTKKHSLPAIIILSDFTIDSPLSSTRSNTEFLPSGRSSEKGSTSFPRPIRVPSPRNSTVAFYVPHNVSIPPRLKEIWEEFMAFLLFVWLVLNKRVVLMVRRVRANGSPREDLERAFSMSSMV